MNAVRKRKLIMLLSGIFILGSALGLVLYGLGQNLSLFYTPTQISNGEAEGKKNIRLGGMVVKGSVVRASDDLCVEFELTDFKNTVKVHYNGILPDLFREEQGIIAQGELLNQNYFKAKEVLAKHDANYMPPELRNTLNPTGTKTIRLSQTNSEKNTNKVALP